MTKYGRAATQFKLYRGVAKMTSDFLSVRDLATRYNINTRTVYRLEKQGKLPPCFRVGVSRRWRLSDIEEFENTGKGAR